MDGEPGTTLGSFCFELFRDGVVAYHEDFVGEFANHGSDTRQLLRILLHQDANAEQHEAENPSRALRNL